MRLIHVLVMFSLLLLVGCGGGGGGGATAPDDFTVPTSLSLGADYSSAAVGTIATITTTGHYGDSSTKNLTSSSNVTLSSSNDAVAVPVFGTSIVKAVGQGTVVITATWQNTSGDVAQGSMTLTVNSASPTAVNVSPATTSIPEGATQAFTVSVTFSNGITQDIPNDLVTWSSSDELLAVVNTSGVATGVGAGSATITATFDGSSTLDGNAELTVEAILESITATANPSHIILGTVNTSQMTVTGHYSDGSTVDLTAEAAYSINTTIQGAFVTSTGEVVGISAVGTVTVTATYPGMIPATDDIAVVASAP